MSKLAQLIARHEGFYKNGSLPARRHNPGDLRHGPHVSHEGLGPNDVGIEPSDELGWADLERQLTLYAERGLTLEEMIATYAPPSENNTGAYLKAVTEGLGVSGGTTVRDALRIA